MTVLFTPKTIFLACLAGILLFLLSGCGSGNRNSGDTPVSTADGAQSNVTDEGDDGGFLFFGGDNDEQSAGIGVNSFLWRASLDTLSFMPLQSADPFGGVIITDWYQDPQSADERFKVTVYILDQRLRADGIRVAVFRQQNQDSQGWSDAPVEASTALDLENAILTRARQLRIDSIQD